ncbi:hypothetical protein GQ42DRAFT_164326 [Ramicandelaber brevisporus]|nr:hypothetical protein GQ42DRAFT_164326 [Ramicandelaber brevisporus]
METLPAYTPAADDVVPFVHGVAQYQLHPSAAVYKVRPVTAGSADTAVEYGIFDSIGRQEYVYRRSATDGSRQLCLAAGRLASEPNERQLWSIQQLGEDAKALKLVSTKTWEVKAPSTVSLNAKFDSTDGVSIPIDVPLAQIQSGLKRVTTMFAPARTDDGSAGIKLKIATISSEIHEAFTKFKGVIYCRDKTSNDFVSITSIEPKTGDAVGWKEAKVKLNAEKVKVTDAQLAFILLWNVVVLDMLLSADGPVALNDKRKALAGLIGTSNHKQSTDKLLNNLSQPEKLATGAAVACSVM